MAPAHLPGRRGVMVAAIAALVAACAPSDEAPTVAAPPRPDALVSPDEFAALIEDDATFVVNVHTPFAGSIVGTDASIAFDELRAREAELPGRGTTLAVYYRSGTMSAVAVRTLTGMGYDDVRELSGGMQAWSASGRTLDG